MDIFSVITLLGGLAFFLYGMNVMSGGLEKMAKGKLERTLKKVTSNRFLAMGFGAAITIAIQSSSALTVMLVGLVNSGILEFGQTICILYGLQYRNNPDGMDTQSCRNRLGCVLAENNKAGKLLSGLCPCRYHYDDGRQKAEKQRIQETY